MKEGPILFSAPMVKALLAGTKTQTRRIVKKPPRHWSEWRDVDGAWNPTGYTEIRPSSDGLFIQTTLIDDGKCEPAKPSPYGVPGDRLWVRETWRTFERPEDGTDGVLFFADGAFREIENTRAAADLWVDDHQNGKHGHHWRPSIYMRRWASRITLEVTSVRAERLQSISEEDAETEGVTPIEDVGCPCQGPKDDPGPHLPACPWSHLEVDPDSEPHRAAFAVLWDDINGKRAPWATNPWLWVVSFRRLP